MLPNISVSFSSALQLEKKALKSIYEQKQWHDIFIRIRYNLSNAVSWSISAYLFVYVSADACNKVMVRRSTRLFIIWLSSHEIKWRKKTEDWIVMQCQLLWNSALIKPTQGKRTIWSTVNWRWKNSMPREFKMQIKWRFRLLFSFSCRSSNIFGLSKMKLFLEEKKEAQMQSYRILNWIWIWFDVCCAASVIAATAATLSLLLLLLSSSFDRRLSSDWCWSQCKHDSWIVFHLRK